MAKLLKCKRGFTLPELLVVISIVAILTSFGTAAYYHFNRRQKVVQAAGALGTLLREAQSKAITGVKGASCGEKILDGWYVNLAEKKIYGSCGGGTIFGEKSFDLLEGVSLTYSSSEFLFKPLVGETNLASDLTIEVSGFGYSVSLKVGISGDINFL